MIVTIAMSSNAITAKAGGATKDGGKTKIYAGDANNATTIISANPEPQKPTRPLTAYHLFFQLEREYIIQTKPHDGKEDGTAAGSSSGGGSGLPKDDRPIGKQLDENMPFRYRYIHLSPYWYASGSGKRIAGKTTPAKKRKHRKTHGKISFLDLSKCIAARWAKLEDADHATKLYVHKIAGRELDVYKREMKVFKAATFIAEPSVGKDKGVEDCSCVSCVAPGSAAVKSGVKSSKQHVIKSSAHVKLKSQSMKCVPEAPLFGLKKEIEHPHVPLQAAPILCIPEETMPTTTLFNVKAKRKPPPMSQGSNLGLITPQSDPLNLRARFEKQDTQETLVTSNVGQETSVKSNVQTMKVSSGIQSTIDSTTFGSEFSFHPVPSAYWRKYKKRAKQQQQQQQGTKRRSSANDSSSSSRSSVGSSKRSSYSHHDGLHAPYITYDMPGGGGIGSSAPHHRHSYTATSSTSPVNFGELHRGTSSSIRGSYSGSSFDQGNARQQAYHSSQAELESDMASFLARMKRINEERQGERRHSYTTAAAAAAAAARGNEQQRPGWEILDHVHNNVPSREQNGNMNDMDPPDPVAAKDAQHDAVEFTPDDAAGLMNALSGEYK